MYHIGYDAYSVFYSIYNLWKFNRKLQMVWLFVPAEILNAGILKIELLDLTPKARDNEINCSSAQYPRNHPYQNKSDHIHLMSNINFGRRKKHWRTRTRKSFAHLHRTLETNSHVQKERDHPSCWRIAPSQRCWDEAALRYYGSAITGFRQRHMQRCSTV